MKNIDLLIGKFLADDCSTSEKEALNAWLDQSDDNRAYFQSLEKAWALSEEGRSAPFISGPEVEAALLKTKEKIARAPSDVDVTRRYGWSLTYLWRSAAAAIVLLLAGWWFLMPSNAREVHLAAGAKPVTDTLTDGSRVGLNTQSELAISFSGEKRQVQLKGEAFFEVAPDKTRPFIIGVEEITVEVVGTKFNVDNLSDKDRVVVEVTEGKVKVASADQAIFLMQGEKAVYHRVTGQFEKLTRDNNPNVKSWLDKKFVFDETPLGEVIVQLEKVYQVPILLKNKRLAACPVYVVFDNQPIEKIMEILGETLSLTIEQNANSFILDGKNCAD